MKLVASVVVQPRTAQHIYGSGVGHDSVCARVFNFRAGDGDIADVEVSARIIRVDAV